MILINKTARLLVGITVRKGGASVKYSHKNPPSWVPGRNPLDNEYWDEVKTSATMKRWISAGWIQIDSQATTPDPFTPPSQDDLALMSTAELRGALVDPNIPPAWHLPFENEIKRREKLEAETSHASALAPNPTANMFDADGTK